MIKFKTFIWIESAFPSPVVSTLKTHFLGGNSFLISTLNKDKSNEIRHHPIILTLIFI